MTVKHQHEMLDSVTAHQPNLEVLDKVITAHRAPDAS